MGNRRLLSVAHTWVVLVVMLVGGCGARGVPEVAPSATSVDEKLGFHTDQAKGEQRYVVVLSDFPDVRRQYSADAVSARITGFLGPYFRAGSYGNLNLQADVVGPYVMPHPCSYYKISPKNLEVDPAQVLALVTDAANAADDDVDFDSYTYAIISLGATHVEYGMVGLCAVPGMLGFETTSVSNKSGETIRNAAIFGENAHMGTYVHDTLHMLGGRIDGVRLTPCLYDHEIQSQYPHYPEFAAAFINMGYWDPLSSHFAFDASLPPTGLSSWTKMRLNWIDPERIALVPAGETATVRLDPLSDRDASTLVIKIPITDTTYYLVENRQAIDSDANCPTTGVLVLYANDAIHECHRGRAPVKIVDANPAVQYLNDAAYDIGKVNRYVDTKNNVAIVLQQKVGLSYQVLVTTADRA